MSKPSQYIKFLGGVVHIKEDSSNNYWVAFLNESGGTGKPYGFTTKESLKNLATQINRYIKQ